MGSPHEMQELIIRRKKRQKKKKKGKTSRPSSPHRTQKREKKKTLVGYNHREEKRRFWETHVQHLHFMYTFGSNFLAIIIPNVAYNQH